MKWGQTATYPSLESVSLRGNIFMLFKCAQSLWEPDQTQSCAWAFSGCTRVSPLWLQGWSKSPLRAGQSTKHFSVCCLRGGTGSRQICAWALQAQSLCFLQPLVLSVISPTRGGSSPWCQTPGLGCPMWGSSPSLLREDPQACDVPLFFLVTCDGVGAD